MLHLRFTPHTGRRIIPFPHRCVCPPQAATGVAPPSPSAASALYDAVRAAALKDSSPSSAKSEATKRLRAWGHDYRGSTIVQPVAGDARGPATPPAATRQAAHHDGPHAGATSPPTVPASPSSPPCGGPRATPACAAGLDDPRAPVGQAVGPGSGQGVVPVHRSGGSATFPGPAARPPNVAAVSTIAAAGATVAAAAAAAAAAPAATDVGLSPPPSQDTPFVVVHDEASLAGTVAVLGRKMKAKSKHDGGRLREAFGGKGPVTVRLDGWKLGVPEEGVISTMQVSSDVGESGWWPCKVLNPTLQALNVDCPGF